MSLVNFARTFRAAGVGGSFTSKVKKTNLALCLGCLLSVCSLAGAAAAATLVPVSGAAEAQDGVKAAGTVVKDQSEIRAAGVVVKDQSEAKAVGTVTREPSGEKAADSLAKSKAKSAAVWAQVKNRLVVADPFLLQAQLDYEKADQVYAWLFRQTIKARNVGRQDWYDLVIFPGITTKADLRRVMEQSFTRDLTKQLLEQVGEQYKDIEGRLYVRSGARGDDITCGRNSYTLAKVTPEKSLLQVKTELLQTGTRKRIVQGYKDTQFEYVKTKEGWRFASFASVR